MKSTYIILDQAFPADPFNDILARNKTVLVTVTKDDGSTRGERFGLVTPDEIFAMIDAKEEINLNRCFIKGFSLNKYRENKGLSSEDIVELKDVYAVASWWEDVNKFNYATFSGDADFHFATFNGFAFFNSMVFSDVADFSDVTFGSTTYFTSTSFRGIADYQNTTFKDSVKFSFATFSEDADFASATFNRIAKFHSATFYDDANFFAATFSNDADFASATFRQNADFSASTFRGDVYFNPSAKIKTRVQFAHFVTFDSVQFEKTVRFDEVEVKETITFKTAIFKGAAVFDNAIVNSAFFTNTFFQYPVNFIRTDINELDLTGTVFATYAVFNHSNITSRGAYARETYRTIKHELIKINNRLDSAEYQRKEMEEYHTELKEAYKTELKKTDKFKHILDIFVLLCNRISNNYGTNLGQAICFTLIVAGVFFTLHVNLGLRNTYFQWGCHSWEGFFEAFSQSVEYFVQFMFIGHNFDFMGKNHALNWKGYILDATGRIAIGYAYFQIYQALRKFKIT